MKIKKADIVLAMLIAAIGLIATGWLIFYNTDVENGRVVVYVDEQYYGEYPLDEDREIVIEHDGHTNKITIKDEHAQMSFSDCHNQDCVRQGEIHDKSKSIICLPNKVVIQIESGTSEFKAISK